MNEYYTVNQVMERWNCEFPDQPISRQTIYNWSQKYGWIMNPNRILIRQKIQLDVAKVDNFFLNLTRKSN